MNIQQYDIIYVDFGKGVGSEQGGCRPALVIQNDVGNKYSPTIIVAPITSKVNQKHNIPTHAKLLTTECLPLSSMVLMEQIMTIDKTRIKKFIGKVSAQDIDEIKKALKISLKGMF